MNLLTKLILACDNNMSEAARRMGVTPQAIVAWKLRGEVPKKREAKAKEVIRLSLEGEL